jgi:hypothetical protein
MEIEFLELGMTPSGLFNSWTVLSQEIILFLSILTEVRVAEVLCPSEDSVTGNLLIHFF